MDSIINSVDFPACRAAPQVPQGQKYLEDPVPKPSKDNNLHTTTTHHPPIIHPSHRCFLLRPSPEPCREAILEFPVDAQHLSIHRLSAETRVRVGQVGAAEAVAKPPQGIRPVLERNREKTIFLISYYYITIYYLDRSDQSFHCDRSCW